MWTREEIKEKIEQQGSSILTTPTQLVDTKDDKLVEEILVKLLEAYSLLPHNRVGLSANQIGIPYNAAIVLSRPMINLTFKPAQQIAFEDEACFSLEGGDVGIRNVERPSYGWATWFDPGFNKVLEIKLNGFRARVFQHELDHLNGKLCYEGKTV